MRDGIEYIVRRSANILEDNCGLPTSVSVWSTIKLRTDMDADIAEEEEERGKGRRKKEKKGNICWKISVN